jgi:NADH-ubiquinone oxidoreductase chain 4
MNKNNQKITRWPLTGLWDRSPMIAVMDASGIVLGVCYSIWLYNRISYDTDSSDLVVTSYVGRREFLVLISLLILTFFYYYKKGK